MREENNDFGREKSLAEQKSEEHGLHGMCGIRRSLEEVTWLCIWGFGTNVKKKLSLSHATMPSTTLAPSQLPHGRHPLVLSDPSTPLLNYWFFQIVLFSLIK